MKSIDALVIGTSAGGLNALRKIIPRLRRGFPMPVIIVQHMSPDGGNYTADHLDTLSAVRVKEADEKEELEAGVVYLAPSNYHLLIARDKTLCLSVDERVNYSRPSIDVLFETAADAFGERLAALILTGANNDGTEGARKVKSAGGMVIIQNPDDAEAQAMPLSVKENCEVDRILDLEEIAEYLNSHMETEND